MQLLCVALKRTALLLSTTSAQKDGALVLSGTVSSSRPTERPNGTAGLLRSVRSSTICYSVPAAETVNAARNPPFTLPFTSRFTSKDRQATWDRRVADGLTMELDAAKTPEWAGATPLSLPPKPWRSLQPSTISARRYFAHDQDLTKQNRMGALIRRACHVRRDGMSILKAPPKHPKNATLQLRVDEELKIKLDR